MHTGADHMLVSLLQRLSPWDWDAAALLTPGKVGAGWHRACSPVPTSCRERQATEGLAKGSQPAFPSHSC